MGHLLGKVEQAGTFAQRVLAVHALEFDHRPRCKDPDQLGEIPLQPQRARVHHRENAQRFGTGRADRHTDVAAGAEFPQQRGFRECLVGAVREDADVAVEYPAAWRILHRILAERDLALSVAEGHHPRQRRPFGQAADEAESGLEQLAQTRGQGVEEGGAEHCRGVAGQGLEHLFAAFARGYIDGGTDVSGEAAVGVELRTPGNRIPAQFLVGVDELVLEAVEVAMSLDDRAVMRNLVGADAEQIQFPAGLAEQLRAGQPALVVVFAGEGDEAVVLVLLPKPVGRQFGEALVAFALQRDLARPRVDLLGLGPGQREQALDHCPLVSECKVRQPADEQESDRAGGHCRAAVDGEAGDGFAGRHRHADHRADLSEPIAVACMADEAGAVHAQWRLVAEDRTVAIIHPFDPFDPFDAVVAAEGLRRAVGAQLRPPLVARLEPHQFDPGAGPFGGQPGDLVDDQGRIDAGETLHVAGRRARPRGLLRCHRTRKAIGRSRDAAVACVPVVCGLDPREHAGAAFPGDAQCGLFGTAQFQVHQRAEGHGEHQPRAEDACPVAARGQVACDAHGMDSR